MTPCTPPIDANDANKQKKKNPEERKTESDFVVFIFSKLMLSF